MGKNMGDADKWFFIVGWESVHVRLNLLGCVYFYITGGPVHYKAHNNKVTGSKVAGRSTGLVTELKSLVNFNVKYASLKLPFDK